MNIKPESGIIPENEISLYDYWRMLVKRKKTLAAVFLIPLAVATIISFSVPRFYRGESEMTVPELPVPIPTSVITAPNIAKLIGNIDSSKKGKIFTGNPDDIKSVSILLPPKSTDKLSIVIDTETADIIPQAFKDVFNYISMLPEIREEIARIQTEMDLKIRAADLRIKSLIEAQKANRTFLNDISDMIKQRKLPWISHNPGDLVKKDGDLLWEIISLQESKKDLLKKNALVPKIEVGILRPPSITKQPPNSKIRQWILLTGLLSLFAGIFIVFLLEYIDRMKAREMRLRK